MRRILHKRQKWQQPLFFLTYRNANHVKYQLFLVLRNFLKYPPLKLLAAAAAPDRRSTAAAFWVFAYLSYTLSCTAFLKHSHTYSTSASVKQVCRGRVALYILTHSFPDASLACSLPAFSHPTSITSSFVWCTSSSAPFWYSILGWPQLTCSQVIIFILILPSCQNSLSWA